MKTHHLPVFLLLVLFFPSNLLSQNFVGQIADKSSNPIIGSTVHIRETNQGVACNDMGEFQLTLPQGVYQVEYRCLGYKSFSEQITITGLTKITREIFLHENPIYLPEVVVTSKSQEDYAYTIMRKAIKKAPYHQQLVKEYEAESYIKGNMELVKVSKLIDKIGSVDGVKMSDFQGNLFVQESYSTIKYTAPDKYEQVVNAFSSSAPDDMDPEDAIKLSTSSLYLPLFSGLISPLHPKAFGYYTFRYEGYTEEENETINKVKVIPKLKDPQLMEGYIYIADQSWDIRFADLKSNIYGVKQHFTIGYNKLKEIVYMPTTFSNRISGNILGVEGYFNYYASIKYKYINIDEAVALTMEKMAKKKKSLEITKHKDTYRLSTDSLATKQDSTYWMQARNIPLSAEEKQSYVVKDSIQQRMDSVRKTYNNAKFEFSDLLTGGRIGGDSTSFAFKYGGVTGALRDYNFVDGLGLGQKIEISTKINTQNRLTISPEVYYTTARREIVWKTDLSIEYAPMRLGKLSFSVGDVSSDFNDRGANRLDNAISSLVWGKNASMLYRQKYAQVRNYVDLSNGLHLMAQLKIAERLPLENNTSYSFFGAKRKITPNIVSPQYTDLLSYNVALFYTPQHFYSVHKGKKQYEYSNFPTFGMQYSEGFSSLHSHNARFRRIEGLIRQEIKTDLFSKLRYEVGGGTFVGNKEKLNFADYKHFDTSGNLWLITKSPLQSFMLLNPYEASTNRYWFYSHINYHSKYIALKRLPFLQGKLFNESVHLKYLHTPTKKNYAELGYSIDVFNMLSLGAHCSFHKFKYQSIGVRLSFNPWF